MSDCNCKKSNIDNSINTDENLNENNKSLFNIITKYFFKTIGFIIFLLLLPLINVYIIWMIFKMFILNKNVDIKPILIHIGNMFKERNISEDYIDEDEYKKLTEDDVIMYDFEKIK
jgi:hypothetical protein